MTTIPDDIQRAFDAYLAFLVSEETEEFDNEEFERNAAEQFAKLAQLLEPFTEQERLSIIKAGSLKQNPAVAFCVAELCLESKESFDSLIKEGFPYVDSTQIRLWIKHSLQYVRNSFKSSDGLFVVK